MDISQESHCEMGRKHDCIRVQQPRLQSSTILLVYNTINREKLLQVRAKQVKGEGSSFAQSVETLVCIHHCCPLLSITTCALPHDDRA